MHPFDYLMTIASVILGLAVTDLAVSLNRLLAAGRRVRWGLLAPLAALMAFVRILYQWWSWYLVRTVADQLTFEMFLGAMIGAVLLFLMSAAALPDDLPETGPVDLPASYQTHHRRFWGLYLAQWLVMNGINIWAVLRTPHGQVNWLNPGYLIGPLLVSVQFIRARWWHAGVMILMTGLYLAAYLGGQLTPS